MRERSILVVEDEESLGEAIRMNLEMEGYRPFWVMDGEAALNFLKDQAVELIVLDVMLPNIDGFTLCEQLRQQGSDTPVLFLTAKNTSTDRIHGLRIGGDDFLGKPFELEELLLRVNKLVGRNAPEARSQRFTFGDNQVFFDTYEIESPVAGRKTLSKKAMVLLHYLIERKGKVVSREEILEHVWPGESNPTSRTVDNFIMTFRKYFEKDPGHPEHFHSIRGVGYRFTEEAMGKEKD